MRKYINSNNTLWKTLLSDKSLNSDHERGHLPPFPPVTSTIHFSLHSSLSKGMLWASATVSYLIPHTCCLLIVLKPHCGKGPCSLSNDKSMRWANSPAHLEKNWSDPDLWCGVKLTVQVEGTSAAPSAGLIRHRTAAAVVDLFFISLFLFSPAAQTAGSGRHQAVCLCGHDLRVWR